MKDSLIAASRPVYSSSWNLSVLLVNIYISRIEFFIFPSLYVRNAIRGLSRRQAGSPAPQKNCDPPPEFRLLIEGGGKNYGMERLPRRQAGVIPPNISKFQGGIIDKCCSSPSDLAKNFSGRTSSFIEARGSNFLAILLQSMFFCYFSCAKKSKAKKIKKKDFLL